MTAPYTPDPDASDSFMAEHRQRRHTSLPLRFKRHLERAERGRALWALRILQPLNALL
jgi:hypothetical protein